MPSDRPLERPWTRRALCVDLALSGQSQEKLAEKYGVTQPSISDFKKRHATTIQAILDDKTNEFAGIALADKAKRLETYAEIIEKALQPTPKINNKGGYVYKPRASGVPVAYESEEEAESEVVMEIDAGAALKGLRQIAEELGQLPNRVTLGGEIGVTTNYKINGLEPGALK